jgi:hypothetical protein
MLKTGYFPREFPAFLATSQNQSPGIRFRLTARQHTTSVNNSPRAVFQNPQEFVAVGR